MRSRAVRSSRAARGSALSALALVAGLGLGGCAGAAPAPEPPTGPAVDSRGVDSRAVDSRAVDAAYVRAMVPHHEQALELSALARGRAASPDVADLAFRIDRDQVEEIGQMQGVARLLGDAPATGGVPAFTMTGMAAPATLEQLRSLSGAPFDRLWLEAMTAHHRGAIDMARTHLAAAGPGSVLTEFSRSLIRTQQAEIDRMTALLAA